MNEQQIKSISKFLSLVLRHQPEKIELQLDEHGWAYVPELLEKMKGQQISMELLEHVVSTNDKQRFAFDETRTRIRASQGHSIAVELELDAQSPPDYLFHGTVSKFLDAIKSDGLKKMNRRHVHLSIDRETAVKVASRRGGPVILTIDASTMHREGFSFYLSENGVWLTDHVPVRYINF